MILSLRLRPSAPLPGPVPQRRRVIVIGATEAGVSAAFHLGKSALLIEQRGDQPPAGEVQRWQPPDLQSTPVPTWETVWRQLHTVMSGEVKLGCRVTAIVAREHRLHVSTGESFIYDKVVCTLRLEDLQRLIVDEQARGIRGADWWRCWLNGRDIELLDTAAQLSRGDLDGETAGKRVAEGIERAMTVKFSRSPTRARTLFQPKVVSCV